MASHKMVDGQLPMWVNRITLIVRCSLPVFPVKQTCQAAAGMSQRCRNAFDHLIGAREQRERHRVSECLTWFEIDDKAVLARRVHGKTDLDPVFALRLKHLNLSAR